MTEPPDVEALLDHFRGWLEDARSEAEALVLEPPAQESEVQPVGLYRLVEEFTALRHELKLQTRSARGLQEQAETLLPEFRQAIEQFRGVAPREAQAASAAARPLAEALADLDESLDRGRLEVEKARRRLVEEATRALETELDEAFRRHSWLQRRLYRAYHEQVRQVVRHDAERRRSLFDALAEGYDLIQARLQRALKAERIERIACVGRPVDPEKMTVVEVVEDPERPSGVVVDELRRGYTWQGRVIRFAEVRASRVPASTQEVIAPRNEPGEGELGEATGEAASIAAQEQVQGPPMDDAASQTAG